MLVMKQFSLRRLFVAITLVAIGCGEVAFLRAFSGPPPLDSFQWLAVLTCGPIIGAGLFTPFKRPMLGAFLGLLGFIAFVMFVVTGWD